MRQGKGVILATGTMMVLSMFRSGGTGAQELWGLRLGTWGGEIETGYGTERQRTRSDGSPESDFAHRRQRERLSIRNQGFSVLDPRLFTGSLGLTFDLFRDRDRAGGTEISRQGKLTGYAFDSTLFAEKPYSATFFANRNQNFLVQPFGGRTEIEIENRGATFRLREDSILRDWGIPYFSSNLRAYQEHVKESTSGLGQTFRRDELRNILSFDGHKGFETADLDVRYEFNDLTNLTFLPGSFQTQMANLNYSLDFGPALNRRSDSRISYTSRTGLSPMTFFTVDEHVRIEHYKNLSTDYRYLLTRIDTQTQTTATRNGIFHLQHRLYRNLTTNAQASALRQELPAGTHSSYAGQIDFNYQRGLPWNGKVFAHTGGRYQIDDNKLGASRINVIDESQVAPSPLGGGAGFLLGQSFVIASTIEVVDSRGGARLPTTPGVDYDIVPEGDLIRIVPLLGSLVIQPGDPLAVSYTYEVDPSIKYATDARWFNAGVDFRWIAVSFGHEQSDQTLLSGGANRFLEDRRKDTGQLVLRGAWKTLQGETGFAATHYNATRLAYTQQRFNQRVSFRPAPNLVLALNAEAASTDYRRPARQNDTRSVRLTLDWQAPGGWWTTADIGRRVYKDSLMPTETVNEARFSARLTYGKLEIVSGLALIDRSRGAFQVTDRRFDLKLTRRF
jgi:hypothetical protein